MDKKKFVLPVLYSLPIISKLNLPPRVEMNLPPRAETLTQIESGALEFLDFEAAVFGTGPIHNPFAFRPGDMPAFAASFEGKPYLRDHNRYEIDARDGTILASYMQPNGAFLQTIRLTTRRGMADYIEGKMDRFSVGFDSEDVFCTICNSSFYSSTCNHYPGMTYKTPTGDQVCQLLFVNPTGLETSAVNVPAVDGTGIVAALGLKHEIQLTVKLEVADDDETDPNAPDRQEPDEGADPAEGPAQARRNADARSLVLAEKVFIKQGDAPMNIRELMSKRAASLTAARELHTQAEAENRDLSVEERANFGELMAEAEALETQIVTIQDERARLVKAEAATLGTLSSDPIKPTSAAEKLMKRADYDKLSVADQGAYTRSGGVTED